MSKKCKECQGTGKQPISKWKNDSINFHKYIRNPAIRPSCQKCQGSGLTYKYYMKQEREKYKNAYRVYDKNSDMKSYILEPNTLEGVIEFIWIHNIKILDIEVYEMQQKRIGWNLEIGRNSNIKSKNFYRYGHASRVEVYQSITICNTIFALSEKYSYDKQPGNRVPNSKIIEMYKELDKELRRKYGKRL